ncbi:MAG TPA: type II toxin-antitoxin system Phd/YefM family antitoxin [Caulobacteraceae bacterium]
MADDAWSLAEAKAKFSEVVEKALTEGPQHVTRNGRPVVVIVPETEWARVSAKGRSFVDVLLDPSVRGILTPEEATLFERDRDPGRPPPKF